MFEFVCYTYVRILVYMIGLISLYYIYVSCVRVYVTELLPDGWTVFDEIFCVRLGGFEDGLDSQFGPLENVYLTNFSFISSC